MNIQAEKLDIIERFMRINDKTLINAIKGILDYTQQDSTARLSLEDYNKELNLSEAQILEGKGIDHANFKDQLIKW